MEIFKELKHFRCMALKLIKKLEGMTFKLQLLIIFCHLPQFGGSYTH